MSKFLAICIFATVALVQVSRAQFNSTCRGTLPNVITPAHFFDVDRMMGEWSLHTSWANDPINPPQARCQRVTFSRGQGAKDILAVETMFNTTTGEVVSYDSGIVIDRTLPLESIWRAVENGVKMTELVWVQTTHDDWALMYGCRVSSNLEYMVLFLRNPEREIDAHTFDILKTVAKGYGFLPEYIEPIDNSKC